MHGRYRTSNIFIFSLPAFIFHPSCCVSLYFFLPFFFLSFCLSFSWQGELQIEYLLELSLKEFTVHRLKAPQPSSPCFILPITSYFCHSLPNFSSSLTSFVHPDTLWYPHRLWRSSLSFFFILHITKITLYKQHVRAEMWLHLHLNK